MGLKLTGVVLSLMLLGACQEATSDMIGYNRDVRPILNDKCLRCHGGVKANGGFSLLFEQDAFANTESGKQAIVRGNAQSSELYKRLVHQDPELRMPQDAAPLSSREIDIIKRWIDQGAKWEKHWAYVLPEENEEPPEIENVSWIRNGIDSFVYAKMEDHGLRPAAEADKAILMRRVYLHG